MLSFGEALNEVDERGQAIIDNNFLLILNAHHESISFKLPKTPVDLKWRLIVDTSLETGIAQGKNYPTGELFPLQARTLALFTQDSKARNIR